MNNNEHQSPSSHQSDNSVASETTESSPFDETSSAGFFTIHEPRTLPAGRGSAWIFEGFEYFKQAPGTWVGICILGFIIMVALNLIPVIGLFAGVLSSVWTGGLMLGCRSLDDGKGLEVGHLFAGFKRHFAALLGLSALMMLVSWSIMAILLWGVFKASLSGDSSQIFANIDGEMLMINGLIALALLIPVYMGLWFAPCLIVLGGFDVISAIKMSFKGCLANMVSFLIYGLVMFGLLFVASIPLGLGLLIVIPMLFASMYISFKDIYVTR